MTIERLQELRNSLDNEDISYGEIVELDNAAKALHINWSDEMTASDVLSAIEDTTGLQTNYQGA